MKNRQEPAAAAAKGDQGRRPKQFLWFFSVLTISYALCACGTEKASTEGDKGTDSRAELTQEEIESGHASFQMDENLVVDADITPKEKYAQGLASYYIKVFSETEKTAEKQFEKNPTAR